MRGPGEHLVEAGMRISHLIRTDGSIREGAYAYDAELTRFAVIYVVRASGAAIASNQSKWFGSGGSAEFRPRDTIVAAVKIFR